MHKNTRPLKGKLPLFAFDLNDMQAGGEHKSAVASVSKHYEQIAAPLHKYI